MDLGAALPKCYGFADCIGRLAESRKVSRPPTARAATNAVFLRGFAGLDGRGW